MLNKLRIGPKLLLAPGVVLALLLLMSGAAWYGMLRQHAWLEHLVQVRAARLEAAAAIAGEVKHAHANAYQLLAWINGSFAQTRLDALRADIGRRHADVDSALAALAGVADPAERALVGASAQALAAYRASVADTLDMAAVDQSLATSAMQKAEQQFGALGAHLAQLSALEKKLSMAAYHDAATEFRALVAAMAALVLLSIALSLAVTVLVRRAMLSDIRAIGDVVDDLAHGRLAVGGSSRGGDEIADTARALDHTIVRLGQTMRAVIDSVASIDSAAQEIASGNLDLSARTEMQASALEETTSAMAALTAAVTHNAAGARRASDLAGSAALLAAEGALAVERAVATMEQVKADARKIADIIGVMDAIALQTNILALNAAVEAARAGAQGRGFAVVAGEVRALAQRSAQAAAQVKQLIAASLAGVDAGNAAVASAGGAMSAIVASVRQVSTITETISSASGEQAEGIAEVNLALLQMDDMTQQNAALVEQAGAAAASLHQQAASLARAVAIFQVGHEQDGPDELYRYRGEADSEDGYPALAERRSPSSAMRVVALRPGRRRQA